MINSDDEALSVQQTFRTLILCAAGLVLAVIGGLTACNFPYGAINPKSGSEAYRVIAEAERDVRDDIANVERLSSMDREEKTEKLVDLYKLLVRLQRVRKQLEHGGTAEKEAQP